MANSEPQIIYEDEAVLVVNKPAGMVVNNAQSVKEETVQSWFARKYLNSKHEARNTKQYLNSKNKNSKSFEFRNSDFEFSARGGIVHRLDKETSGVMVIAKTPEALAVLQRQFKERKVAKKYVAMVYGKLEPKAGVIAVPLGRSKQNREKFTVKAGGKAAETEYRVKRYYSGYTQVELRPRTGRTHQIRVHLAYMGHPVVGDERYAGQKQSRADRLVEPRHRLEAVVLGFYHPVTGRWMEFKL